MADSLDPIPTGGTDQFNPFITAADTANLQAGAPESIFTRGRYFTSAALSSGFLSIYNTVANYVGADKVDVADWLDKNDEDIGAYYRANKDLVDTAGFIATSFVPGGLALKGLQLAKAGILGGTFARVLGYASSSQQAWVSKGLAELAAEGGTVYNQINRAKLAAMSWGVADQMLSVGAFETAIAATMKQSPLLENDSLADVAKHIALTSLAFGAIGGGLEAIAVNSVFKGASRTIDKALNNSRVLTDVQGDLAPGDKAYGILSSMLELPKEAETLPYTYKLAGKENKLELPIKEAVERTRSATEQRAWEEFRTISNTLADNDANVGQSFAGFIERTVKSMQADGANVSDIQDRLRDHLLNVGKIVRVSEKAAYGTDDIFYVADKLPIEKLATIKDFESFVGAVKSRAPTGNDVSGKPYRLVGSGDDINLAVAGFKSDIGTARGLPRFPTVADAFEAGHDAVVLANGQIRINPKSERFIHVDDPVVTPRSYFNTRTGAFTDVAFPNVADIATATKPLAMTSVDHLVSGGRNFSFKPFDDFRLSDHNTISASARYVYAEQLKVVPNKIADTDIPLLERIFQDGAAKHPDVLLVDAANIEKRVGDIADFGEWMKSQKLLILQNHLSAGSEDITSIAAKMNVEPQWVQEAISRNFLGGDTLSKGMSLPLTDAGKVANVEVRWDFTQARRVARTLQAPKKETGSIVSAISEAGKKYFINGNDNVLIQNLPDGAGNTVGGVLGWQYRVKVAKETEKNAFFAVAGTERASRFPDWDSDAIVKIATQEGAGPGVLSFANADYGNKLELLSQHSGVLTNKWIKDESNTALSTFHPIMLQIQENPQASAELGVLTTATRRTPDRFKLDPKDPKRLVNAEAFSKDEESGALIVDEGKVKALGASGRRAEFPIENDNVAEWVQQWITHNDGVNDKLKPLIAARGFNFNKEPGIFYPPSVDTSRYPYFAFVRKKPEFLGASSEVSMITARSEQELRQLTDKVPTDYQVLFDRNTKEYFKAKGEYDYQLTLKENTVDSTLQRSGVLGSFFPETRAENVLEDYVRGVQQKSARFVRYAVETRYSQTFAELRGIGKQFEEVGTSKFGGVLKKFKSQVENPFEDYIKTALDVSKRSEYTLLHEANEFVESMGASAYRFFDTNYEKAMKGTVSWEEANKLSTKYGLGAPYSDEAAYFRANAPADRNAIKEFVGKANMSLVNVTLRLDLANSLVNIISTPILLGTEMASIKSLVASDSALAGKLSELRSIAVPGVEGYRVPSTTGLLFQATKNFWSEGKAELLKRYEDLGAVKNMLSQYHEMIEHLSYKPYKKVSELVERGNKGLEVGAKISGNEFAEQFTRFVSADVMRQLTDSIVQAGRMSVAEQDAYISVFVNRVQGNYLASQRPIAFQGVLGSAVSLFQTYQFNLLQQLFRHIENRDTRALAVLGGLQSGIYGLNGVPFVEAINTHLVGNSNLNPNHKDVYSTVPQIAGKALGDWMMYGTASAFPLFGSQSPALYTRGDINPRHISIIPISPLDVPAVDGSIRFVKNLIDTGKKLSQGADVSSSLLEGLEHNGLSRPLAGIAQVFGGYSTTSKGSLVAAANDFSAVATLSRVSGAKPMDESLALNSLFRMNSYQAADQAKLQELGEAVKTKLRIGKSPTPDELHNFQLEYAKSGGRIENYSKTLQRWSKDSNTSVVNQLIQNHRSSYSRRMTEIMGGTTLPDYRNRVAPLQGQIDTTEPESVEVPAQQ